MLANMKTRAPRQGIPAMVPLLTTAQVTGVLGVSLRTLHRYMDARLIKPIGTAGQAYLFDERAVTELRRQLALRREKARGGGTHGKKGRALAG